MIYFGNISVWTKLLLTSQFHLFRPFENSVRYNTPKLTVSAFLTDKQNQKTNHVIERSSMQWNAIMHCPLPVNSPSFLCICSQVVCPLKMRRLLLVWQIWALTPWYYSIFILKNSLICKTSMGCGLWLSKLSWFTLTVQPWQKKILTLQQGVTTKMMPWTFMMCNLITIFKHFQGISNAADVRRIITNKLNSCQLKTQEY